MKRPLELDFPTIEARHHFLGARHAYNERRKWRVAKRTAWLMCTDQIDWEKCTVSEAAAFLGVSRTTAWRDLRCLRWFVAWAETPIPDELIQWGEQWSRSVFDEWIQSKAGLDNGQSV